MESHGRKRKWTEMANLGDDEERPCSSKKSVLSVEEDVDVDNEDHSVDGDEEKDCWHSDGVTDNERYLTHRLSDETLLVILRLLHETGDDDVLACLSLTCHKMKILIQDKELCDRLRMAWWTKVSIPSLLSFIKDQSRPGLLTRIDVSDLYWVPSWMLRNVLVKIVNVTELLVAGTSLSWSHLYEIIEKINCITKLSMSYDSAFESAVRNNNFRIRNSSPDLAKISNKLENLKQLLIHIPMPNPSTTPSAVNSLHAPRTVYEARCVTYTYAGVAYLLNCCANLEELWLIGWPKTSQERKLTVFSSDEIHIPNGAISMRYLKKLVISMKQWPRMSSSIMTQQLFLNLKINSQTRQRLPEVVWLDHPLLDLRIGPHLPRVGANRRCGRRSMTTFIGADVVCKAKRMSYSLTYASAQNPPVVPGNPDMTHLLLMHGAPSLVTVNLNGFDAPSNLKSFCITAFNVKIDWDLFVQTHSNLRELSILNYVAGSHDYCAALSSLTNLEKLSISFDCLFEIKSAKGCQNLLNKLNSGPGGQLYTFDEASSEQSTSSKAIENSLFKSKRRVGVQATTSSENKIGKPSGLTLLSVGCPNMNELEIGYDDASPTGRDRAGNIMYDSLASISRWEHLKKLSLKNLNITNGKCFYEIFSKCKKLQSVRLTHLGLSGKCNYIMHLANALPLCQSLRDFRLEQNNVGSLFGLLEALSSCSQLRRLLIYSCPNDQPLNLKPVFELFRACPELMMFYAIVDKTPKKDCTEARKYLERHFLKLRPALSVIIRNSTVEDDLIRYPSVHYRTMVVDESQVCQFNDFAGMQDS